VAVRGGGVAFFGFAFGGHSVFCHPWTTADGFTGVQVFILLFICVSSRRQRNMNNEPEVDVALGSPTLTQDYIGGSFSLQMFLELHFLLSQFLYQSTFQNVLQSVSGRLFLSGQ
jgi:hypothetical protein